MFIKTQYNSLVNTTEACSIRGAYYSWEKEKPYAVNVEYSTTQTLRLGQYETEARAHEVLHDIYGRLARGARVYTMPKE